MGSYGWCTPSAFKKPCMSPGISWSLASLHRTQGQGSPGWAVVQWVNSIAPQLCPADPGGSLTPIFWSQGWGVMANLHGETKGGSCSLLLLSTTFPRLQQILPRHLFVIAFCLFCCCTPMRHHLFSKTTFTNPWCISFSLLFTISSPGVGACSSVDRSKVLFEIIWQH